MVGGAAMALEYDAVRQTEDIDVVIRRYESEVLAAAEAVAAENADIEPDWLNQTAKAHKNLPRVADPTSERRTRGRGSASTAPDRNGCWP